MVILTDMVMVKVRLIPIKDVILLLYVDSVLYLIHVSKEVEIDMRLWLQDSDMHVRVLSREIVVYEKVGINNSMGVQVEVNV